MLQVGNPIVLPLLSPRCTTPSIAQGLPNKVLAYSILPFLILFLISVEEIIKFFLLKGTIVFVLYLNKTSLFFNNLTSPILFFPNLKFLLIKINLVLSF